MFHAAEADAGGMLTGRLLDAAGRPVPKASIYKQYTDDDSKPETWIRDADFPQTDPEGRFQTNVPTALRSSWSPARAIRPGRITRSPRSGRPGRYPRLAGREGLRPGARRRRKPVGWISVTTPAVPDSSAQPNFVYKTGEDGSFRTDGGAGNSYPVRVGDIYRTEDGKDSLVAVKDMRRASTSRRR